MGIRVNGGRAARLLPTLRQLTMLYQQYICTSAPPVELLLEGSPLPQALALVSIRRGMAASEPSMDSGLSQCPSMLRDVCPAGELRSSFDPPFCFWFGDLSLALKKTTNFAPIGRLLGDFGGFRVADAVENSHAFHSGKPGRSPPATRGAASEELNAISSTDTDIQGLFTRQENSCLFLFSSFCSKVSLPKQKTVKLEFGHLKRGRFRWFWLKNPTTVWEIGR
ncbi:hypothetical protein VTI74DRAFT_6544 [Chaetomium olivicolor]